ncbi:hypothetical protein, partial [Staphylococcus epidermidis]|uniref:hypothetical protein n=1 Tax=Staphylococcus epidermidis TaxID=1282 RepID=UPI001C92CB7B
ENEECKGGLMGGNMEGEAVGLMIGEAGFVGRGMEEVGGRECGGGISGKDRGGVEDVECNEILVGGLVEENGSEDEGELDGYGLGKLKG